MRGETGRGQKEKEDRGGGEREEVEREEERDGESGRGLCWVCVCVCERLSAQKLHPQSSVFNSRHTDRRTESESSKDNT